MEEAFVKFETALLLKSKGFNWPVQRFYDKNGNICAKYCDYSDGKGWDSFIKCPTQEMVMDWFRTNYKIHISPYYTSIGWYYEIFNLNCCDITGCEPFYRVGIPSKELTKETCKEAIEEAIKHTLEHLI